MANLNLFLLSKKGTFIMKSTTKTRKALSNPVVRKKLEFLKAHWESLSKAEKDRYIDELRALGCPNTKIADALALKESAIRYYGGAATSKKASVIPSSNWGNVLDKIFQMDNEPVRKAPDPPVLSRREQVKRAVIDFVRDHAGPGSFQLQTLDLATQRCDELEYSRNFPPPVPPDVSPKAVFAEYNPKDLEMNPGAPVEFLAITVLRLMPQGYERDPLLREVEAEYRSNRLRN